MAKSRSTNQYDKIFRENIESVFLPLAERSLGVSIVSREVLLDKIVSTTTREMDSLYKIETADGNHLVLHLEVQTSDNKEMIYRVSEYHALILRKYKLPVKHIVIYLGKSASQMRSELKDEEIFKGFELLSIYKMDTSQLLASKIPEEVLLAVLSNFDKKDGENVIKAVLFRLQNLCKDRSNLKKYATQLTVLSKLRNLEVETIRKIKEMTQWFDVTTSILFQEGREEGLEMGELKKQLIVIANMLTMANLDIAQIAALAEVEESFVTEIKEKIETETWSHPDTWTDEDWSTYFEKNQNNTALDDLSE